MFDITQTHAVRFSGSKMLSVLGNSDSTTYLVDIVLKINYLLEKANKR